MKKLRMLMIFVCTFAVAPAVFADSEIRNNAQLTKNGRADCEALRKQVAGTSKSGQARDGQSANGTVVR